jgi:hypothetical protein
MFRSFLLNIYRLATTLKFPMVEKGVKFKLIKVWCTAETCTGKPWGLGS